MTKHAATLILALLLAVAIPFPVHAQDPPKTPPKEVDISGVWDLTVQTPQGEMTNDATFTQEKEVLKVTMAGPQGMPMAGEGTVKEGVVTWTVKISTPQGDFALVFAGKIDGDKMAGDVQMGDFGTSGWSAKRKK